MLGHSYRNDLDENPVNEVFELLRESSQASKSTHVDSLENHELVAPADHFPRSQPGAMNQRLCWSLKEAAEQSKQRLFPAHCMNHTSRDGGMVDHDDLHHL
jgi:hypothetical protein